MTRAYLALPLLLLLSGCASLLASGTGKLADDLSSAILNQDDLQTVRDGAPAYLLLVDGLIEGDRDNQKLLITGARLYGAYATVFVTEPARAQRMTEKARGYATRALCLRNTSVCHAQEQPYESFAAALAGLATRDVPLLYAYAASWAGWIQTHSDDWNAVADLPKVEAAMRRVVELDEGYDHGGAHLYLGVLASLRPPALGGKPDEGQAHFRRAIELSQGRNLMAKVQYALKYARLTFDRNLHDQLLHEVLDADAKAPGLTLINTLAKQQAQELLASAKDYF
jgi:hypothetical protein